MIHGPSVCQAKIGRALYGACVDCEEGDDDVKLGTR